MMSFIKQGKHALLLTMLLTGVNPSLVFGQNLSSAALKNSNSTTLFIQQAIKDKKVFGKGTDLSGGGTSIKITKSNGNQSRVLLDFYNFGHHPQNDKPGILLARTEALKNLGIEKLELQKTSFYNDLQKQFQHLKTKSPLFTQFIEQASQNISIYYTTYQIPKLDINTYLPDIKFHENLEARSVAFYAKGFGILISVKEFEQLSYENQKGLILHEIIRHLQIGYGFKMIDETVQILVNNILTTDSTESLSLDSAEYFGAQKWKELNEANDPAQVQIIFNESAQLIEKHSGEKLASELSSAKNSNDVHIMAHQLKNSLSRISISNIKCLREQKTDCVNTNDWSDIDLLIAKLRVVILTGLVEQYNKIEDNISDRTLLLKNTHELDIQIECANNNLCSAKSSKNQLTGPFVEFLKSGDITLID